MDRYNDFHKDFPPPSDVSTHSLRGPPKPPRVSFPGARSYREKHFGPILRFHKDFPRPSFLHTFRSPCYDPDSLYTEVLRRRQNKILLILKKCCSFHASKSHTACLHATYTCTEQNSKKFRGLPNPIGSSRILQDDLLSRTSPPYVNLTLTLRSPVSVGMCLPHFPL